MQDLTPSHLSFHVLQASLHPTVHPHHCATIFTSELLLLGVTALHCAPTSEPLLLCISALHCASIPELLLMASSSDVPSSNRAAAAHGLLQRRAQLKQLQLTGVEIQEATTGTVRSPALVRPWLALGRACLALLASLPAAAHSGATSHHLHVREQVHEDRC